MASELSQETTRIVGVRFQQVGRVYFFNPVDLDLSINDYVVVETPHGNDIARVVIAPEQVLISEMNEPLKPILRKASADDIRKMRDFENKEEEVLTKCRELINKFNLSEKHMKPVKARYNLDGTHLTIFFRAEKRIDFRQLVRELASIFKTRVELRQVGPRDETKLIGGIGRCGLPLCCATFLTDFNPLSIKMAKEQNLPLNPTKISGTCGRLLCCLRYEDELYHTIKEKMPQIGQQVITPLGSAEVVEVNLLKETVTAHLENGAVTEFNLADISTRGENNRFKQRRRRRKK